MSSDTMYRVNFRFYCLTALMLALITGTVPCRARALQAPAAWRTQFGTAGYDEVSASCLGPNGVYYVAGSSDGGLFGPKYGTLYMYVCALRASDGTRVWGTQLGTGVTQPNPAGTPAQHDVIRAISVDASGNVTIAGVTLGNLFGVRSGTTADAFVARLNPSGAVTWGKQFGPSSGSYAAGDCVAVTPDGGAVVGGFTSGDLFGHTGAGYAMWLTRYDASGAPVWAHQWGDDASTMCSAVAVDASGGIYIAGQSTGAFAVNATRPDGSPPASAIAPADTGKTVADPTDTGTGEDAFVARLDGTGTLIWAQEFGGRNSDLATSIAVGADGSAAVGGTMNVTDDPTSPDAFVARFDATGRKLWLNLLSTPAEDNLFSVATDSAGRVFACGSTKGALFAANPDGADHAWLACFDGAGSAVWAQQFAAASSAGGIEVDGSGWAFAAGDTPGSLFSTSLGGSDCWAMKFNGSAPAAVAMRAVAGATAVARGSHRPADDMGALFAAAPGPVHRAVDKSLLARWNGRPLRLAYAPIERNGRAYVDLVYLAWGAAHRSVKVVNDRAEVVRNGVLRTYHANRRDVAVKGAKEACAGGVPLQIDGRIYVPTAEWERVAGGGMHLALDRRHHRLDWQPSAISFHPLQRPPVRQAG